MKSEKEALDISMILPSANSNAVSPNRSKPILISSTYEASNARPVNAAEPIAKPLPVAAVVLPKESSASVRLRTSLPKPDISALPPALSAIGPYASVANVIPNVESIPTAAIPIPYNPIPILLKSKPEAKRKELVIPTTTANTGTAVDNIPKPKPEMITVAGPVKPDSDTFLVGLND